MIAYDISIKYMIGGYAVIFIVLAFYLVSLVVRWKRLKRDYEILQERNKD